MIWKPFIAIIIASSAVLSSSYEIAPQVPVPQEYRDPGSRDAITGALLGVGDGRTIRILKDLIECESRGNPNAKNPKDKDGSPSWGILQFKPETLYSFGEKYGIIKDMEPKEIMNVIYDPVLQIKVAGEMIKEYGHKQSFWEQQFPACSKKHKYWKELYQ